jgi:plasmid replication initiation protein
MKMSGNRIVRKDNFLITASYKLTLNEQRVILTAIAKVPFDQPIPKKVIITARELLSNFPDIGEQHVYEEMDKATQSLLTNRLIVVEDPNQKEQFKWISSKTTYKKGEGRIGFSFSQEVIPYIQQLKEKFTKYHLQDISSLKSIYSIRLYEMLMQFQNTTILIIQLDKFKERLDVSGRYNVFQDLKKRVIEPAINELNHKTHFNITFKGIREGRAIKNLEFFFSERQ